MARHLTTLRENGLITTDRVAGEVRLRIAGPLVKAFLDAMCHWVHPETGETMSVTPILGRPLAIVGGEKTWERVSDEEGK